MQIETNIELPDLLAVVVGATEEGGGLVTGPSADENRERLTELAADTRQTVAHLLETLREMQRLAGNA